MLKLRARLLLSLCRKSALWLATLRCCLASLNVAFLLLLEPLIFLLSLLCESFNLFSDLSKYLGLAITSLLDKVAKFSSPTSIPTFSVDGCLILTSGSSQEKQ